MKIILLKDIKGQGKKDDIIEVKDGYGNNFLIKNGYGIAATSQNIKQNNLKKSKEQKAESNLIESLKEIKQKLEKEKIVFSVSTGKDDKVFGSISNKQIKKALDEKEYEIDKNKILIENPITSLGFHQVLIHLHKDVIAKIDIELVKEK